MTTTISLPALRTALDRVKVALPKRPNSPVMGGVRIVGHSTGVRLTTYDYDTAITVNIPGGPSDLDTVIDAKRLEDVTKKLHQRKIGAVSLRVDGERVVVTHGAGSFDLKTLPAEDYPTVPTPAEHMHHLHVGDLRELLRVSVAVSSDDALPVITGVHLDVEDATATAAATDRYRLACTTVSIKAEEKAKPFKANVPAKTFGKIVKVLAHPDKALADDTPVGLGFDAETNTITFASLHATVTMRCIAGEFPKWRALLPDDEQIIGTPDRLALVQAVDTVSVVCEGNTPVALRPGTKTLTVEDGNTGEDDAHATETIASAAAKPPRRRIGVNPNYLLDGARTCRGDVLSISGTNVRRPLLLRGNEDSGFTYLVMPVRLDAATETRR